MITDFRLHLFTIVARELSFTRAATELNISQPAVTKHIKELERATGMALFLRQNNRISLTEGGQMLLGHAHNILNEYQKLNDNLQEQSGSFSGRVRLGASSTIIQYILPSILAKFNRRYPNIEILLKGGNSEEMAHEVLSEQIDFAVVEGAEVRHSFHYEHLANDEIVLVSAKAHQGSLPIERLRDLPLVIREMGSGTLDVIERGLSERGIHRREMNIVMEIGSSEGIIRYLLQSNCYAFISLSAVKERIASGELHRVELDIEPILRELRIISLHGKSGRLSSILINFFMDNIAEAMR